MKDWNSRPAGGHHPEPSDRVVAAVADVEDVSPVELPPLTSVIDPDAVDNLVTPPVTGDAQSEIRVIFEYYGYTIVVDDEGCVTVQDSDW